MNKLSNLLSNKFRSPSNHIRIRYKTNASDEILQSKSFRLNSFDIKSKLKKTIKHESFVFKSFFGELDSDYLIFPVLPLSNQDKQSFYHQYQQIRQAFSKTSNQNYEFLKQCGFYDLSSFTELEKSYLFEALGSSLEYNFSVNKNETSTNLITIDKLTVTDSMLTCYKHNKRFISLILPLVHNSLVLNTLQASSNNQIKEKYLTNFRDKRVGFAFDEPSEDFVSVPYPYWNSTATFDPETKTWTLSGEKTQILKNDYDNFLITCKINSKSNSPNDCGIATFMVPSDKLKIEKDGTNNYGTSYLKISFDRLNVEADRSEVLLDENATHLLNLKSTGQIVLSAIILGIMKQLHLNMVQSVNLVPYPHLLEHLLTTITEKIYALESMIYLTSSHYDTFELDKMDLYLQSLIIQTLAAEFSEDVINLARFLFDSKRAQFVISNSITDVLNVLNSSIDSPASNRMLLAAYGMRHIGRWRFDHIAKLKLQRIYPLHAMKSSLFKSQKKKHNLRYDNAGQVGLEELKKLNPKLKHSGECLKQVLDIETNMGNHILEFYGKECIKHQIDLNRFASIVMSAFQMVSVISRANHSLNISSNETGSYSEQEFKLCENICKNELKKVKQMEELIVGILEIAEETRSKMIHRDNMRWDGYFAKPTFDRVV